MKQMKIYLFAIMSFCLFVTIACEDENPNPKPEEPPVSQDPTDANGNKYKTVTLGEQTWLTQNLRATSFSDGTAIKTTNPATLSLNKDGNEKYQWAYDGDETLVEEYGRLYTWDVVGDTTCKVCPDGWHVPSEKEFEILYQYHKDNGLELSDTNGFNLKYAGIRSSEGKFLYINKNQSYFWSTTTMFDAFIYFHNGKSEDTYSRQNGYSVRCIKD